MSKRVHYLIGRRIPEYACGVGKRWSSQDITGTRSRDAVTCKSCRRVIRNVDSTEGVLE